MVTVTCIYCGKIVTSERKSRKFCSNRCMQKYHNGSDKERACKECGTIFEIVTQSDANRRYCSQKCAKRAYSKQQSSWAFEHPDELKEYRTTYLKKNPSIDKDKKKRERIESINLLGGGCIVCGVTNPNWLHIDYIPTTRGLPFRHPRHLKYIREHLSDFRLLCANHHYELTLTGKIEGTDITQ